MGYESRPNTTFAQTGKPPQEPQLSQSFPQLSNPPSYLSKDSGMPQSIKAMAEKNRNSKIVYAQGNSQTGMGTV